MIWATPFADGAAMSQIDIWADKQLVEHMLKQLPEDCTLEDIQYHLYVLQKIQSRLRMADRDEFVPQGEVEQRMVKWLNR